MQNLSSTESSTELQEQLGRELIRELVTSLDVMMLEAALLDERHPLALDLQTAVQLAVDAGRVQARQIVVLALTELLTELRSNGRNQCLAS